MAREAYRSLYGDLAKLKGASLLDGPVADSTNDDALFQLLLAVSAYVDSLCNRHFYPLTETRRFDGTAEAQLAVPDLVSVSSLRSDDDDDGIYETTWADADYELTPQNAAPTAHWGAPHQALRVRSHGAKQQFQRGHSRYETAAVWATASTGSRRAPCSPLRSPTRRRPSRSIQARTSRPVRLS